MEALAKTFPAKEKYRLSDQLIRSARSINGNILKGHGRHTYKDQLHFCIQTQGSLSEVLNHLIDAYDCTYITQEQLHSHSYKINSYKIKYNEIEAFLNGYISYLRSKI